MRLAALTTFLLASLLALAATAGAATYTVDSTGTADDAAPGNGECRTVGGVCTLRAAVREADAGAASDRVVVPAGTYTLAATLQVNHPLTLEGAGASATAIDGNGQIVLRLLEGATAVRGVTVRGGDAQGGGGLLVESGASLTLEDAVVSGNDAFTGGGGIYVKSGGAATIRRTSITGNHATGAFGGGIWNQGELDLIDSVVADNEANRAGGIRNEGEMRLRNVTVSTNRALSPEAGVGGISQNGFAFLNNVTITLNQGRGDIAASFRGGGIQTSTGELTVLVNSVVAANDGHGGPADCVGDLSSDSRYNLIGVTTACGLPAVTTTWKLGVDARLGALANNGSPIKGHLPQATSPLVNAGAPYTPGGPAAGACEGRDARGILRLRCDIGALEREVPVPATITLTSTVDQPDAVPGDGVCATAGGACTLRAAIQEANRLPGAQNVAIPAGAYVLSVAGSEAGLNADAAGDLDLRDELTLTGAGAAASVVDGNALGRILDLEPGASVRLVGLTLHNGRDAGGGAIRATSAQLTIEQAVLSGNVATGPGGAVLLSGLDEVLVVLDSTFQGNRATGFGGSGGAVSAGGQVTVTSSTFAANQAAGAGGALAVNGSLLLERSTVRDNRAEGGALGNGGGISATQAAIAGSTLSGNASSAHGGGLFAGSGSVDDSTVSGNASADRGGGVSTNGTLALRHVTLAANTATAGGADLLVFGSGAVLSLADSILASPGGAGCAGLAPVSAGGNVALDGTCALAGTNDRPGVDPLLGPLANNGGVTLTHLPQTGSPAVDNGLLPVPATDQRGAARPQGPAADSGAVEGIVPFAATPEGDPTALLIGADAGATGADAHALATLRALGLDARGIAPGAAASVSLSGIRLVVVSRTAKLKPAAARRLARAGVAIATWSPLVARQLGLVRARGTAGLVRSRALRITSRGVGLLGARGRVQLVPSSKPQTVLAHLTPVATGRIQARVNVPGRPAALVTFGKRVRLAGGLKVNARRVALPYGPGGAANALGRQLVERALTWAAG